MSKSYDNEIIASTIKLLKEDITSPNPSNHEYCIKYFVEGRVYQLGVPYISEKYPRITIDFIFQDSELGVPSGEGILNVKIWYAKSSANVKTNLRRCGGRVLDLLNRNPLGINSQGFDAKIRTIRRIQGGIVLPKDETEGLMSYEISFDVVFGESWLDS